MGISFVRGAENTLIKQDTVIFDYMKKIEKDINAYKVLYFYTHKLQTEVQGNQLYIQESIGSEGVALVYPQKISGDFIFKFKLMSLTQTGKIKIISRNDDGDYEYIVELQQLRSKQTAKIWRDGALVGQADAFTLKPDVFYQIIFERSGRQLNLEIDGKTVISSTENKPAQNATLGIRIEGRPDHPAAIEIKDVELYYNR